MSSLIKGIATASFAAFVALPMPLAALAATAVPLTDSAVAWRVDGGTPTSRTLFQVNAKDSIIGSVAARDLGADGIDEIVTGSGFGVAPLVRILRQDGSEISWFAPFESAMTQGVNVAAGDLDGDDIAEIIAATGPGESSRVRVFDTSGQEKIFPGGFYPFSQAFKGGVNVASGDLDGDHHAEIIVAAGVNGGPHIKVFRGDGVLLADFFAFDPSELGGLNVTAGDVDGDGKAEIIAALASNADANVRVFNMNGTMKNEFLAIGGGFRGGLNLATGDMSGDGVADVLVAPNGGGGPQVHVFDGSGKLLAHFFAYEETFRGGVLLATGTFSLGAAREIITVTAGRDAIGRPYLPQYINVDISEQRMRLYEYGKLVRTAWVATGLPGMDTPKGEHKILEKPYKVHYAWSYGIDNPNNYDLGWVTWNLKFLPHIYIHYAPWRKVFGVRASHGCVNVNGTDAKWIYEWAAVGTPVTVQS